MIEVTKALAKKLYDEGQAILVIPCKINPKSQLATWTTKPAGDETATFEKLCDIVFYYNCTPETGMKLKYYVKGENE